MAMLLVSALQPHAADVAVVGKFGPGGTDFYELPSLSKIGTSDALGSYSEALLAVPGTCTMAAGSAACCDGSDTDYTEVGHGMGYTVDCAKECSLRTASFSLSAGGVEATSKSAAPSTGAGPDYLAVTPAGELAVSNMGGNPGLEFGGNAAIYELDDGMLKPTAKAKTSIISEISHIHFLTMDGCGGTKAFLADASGYNLPPKFQPVQNAYTPAVHKIDVETGEIEASVPMPLRIRSIQPHPKLPIAYTIYELDGMVGVWTWPKCGDWEPSKVKEIARLPVSPPLAKTGKTGFAIFGVPAPSRLIISPDGKKVFICSRNTPTGDYTSYAVTSGGFFHQGTPGNLTAIETVDTSGANPRECALTPDGKTLLEVDTDAGKLASYSVDSAGHMKMAAVVDGIDQPNTVAVWSAPSKCYASSAVSELPLKKTNRAAGFAFFGTVVLAAGFFIKRRLSTPLL